ncbi:MAG: Type 1 glutamine amidotransferase-like domain-containing protein [Bacteriovoracaceae bacterium]|nr:Type 1 glutamine amidotransferase-like domain-containing protein [Bacteriovoracaceae bacterium]
MKLALYSGGYDFDNEDMDRNLLDVVGRKNPKVAFIPSCSYLSHLDFKEYVDQYRKYNIKRFIHFPIDSPFSDVMRQEVLNCDIIHLAGGNTFYFLKHLRKAKMLKDLKQFVAKGGVLSGLSAGAIIMTRNINTAGFPAFDRDENEDGVKNLNGMGLVNFEFFPHYKQSLRYDKELLKYSMKTHNPIYACPDGSGIFVEGKHKRLIGKCFCFFKGKKFLM